MNLVSVFHLWYMVFLPIQVVNNTIMRVEIHVMPWVRNMHHQKLWTLRWRSVSGCGRETVAVGFGSKGCQYLINGCLQPIGTWITQDAKLKFVNAPLTIILRMRWWPCCYLLHLWKLQIRLWWMTTTKSLVNYRTYKTTNRWRTVDAHCNILSIQHLQRSIIVFIMIWPYWLSFCLIETQPCVKAEWRNILALFTLTWLKMMYLAKRFIAPAIHLCINR